MRTSPYIRLVLALGAMFAMTCILVATRFWSAETVPMQTLRRLDALPPPALPPPPPPVPATPREVPPAPFVLPPPPPSELPRLEVELETVSIPLRATRQPNIQMVKPRFERVRPAPPKPTAPAVRPRDPRKVVPRPAAPPSLIEPSAESAPAALPTPAPVPRPAAVRPTPAPVSPAPRRLPAPSSDPRIQIAQLDETPRLLNRPSVRFPSRLTRRGIREGRVTLEVTIRSSGKVEVEQVIDSTHPELVETARSFASRARFTKPTQKGRPVEAVFRWPLVLRP